MAVLAEGSFCLGDCQTEGIHTSHDLTLMSKGTGMCDEDEAEMSMLMKRDLICLSGVKEGIAFVRISITW